MLFILDGDIDPRVRAVVHALNLTIVIWDRDTDDWKYNDYIGPLNGKPAAIGREYVPHKSCLGSNYG